MNHWFFTPFVPENTATFMATGFFTDIYCPMEKGESLMSDFTGNRYTEPGDFTQDAKVAYLENFPVFVQFLKYGQHVTGFGPKMFTDAPDKRYLPHVICLTVSQLNVCLLMKLRFLERLPIMC
jgi:hypothetical protein